MCPTNTCGARSAQIRLASPRSQSQLTDFSQIPQNPQHTFPVHEVIHIPKSHFLSWIFILTSLNDTSSPAHAWTPALMLHLINPCAKGKVLSLTKPKGKIYKTKSLGHYITQTIEACCPPGVMVRAINSRIVVSELKLLSCYYVHSRINTFGKDRKPLFLPAMC